MKKRCNRMQKRACYQASCPADCLARKAAANLSDPKLAPVKTLMVAPNKGQAA